MSSRSTLTFNICSAVALCATLAASSAKADTISYHYEALDQIALPPPYAFFAPSGVIEGRVFGTVYDSDFALVNVAVYQDGVLTIGPAGMAASANEGGLIGGSDLLAQAALFRDAETTLVPRLAGEASASVIGLGRGGLAFVESIDSSYRRTYAYFRRGTERVIDFGLSDPVFGGFMNDAGVVAVTKGSTLADPLWRGYRYDPRTSTTTVLPAFSETMANYVLVQGINNRGEVLGYSFTDYTSSEYHERVGVWGRDGVFRPYFYQTLNTSMLVFNERNEIVITNPIGFATTTSYLVPKPDTRIDLASIVADVPAGLYLSNIVSIDDQGNMAGYASDDDYNMYPFLLRADGKIGHHGPGGRGHGCKLPQHVRSGLAQRHVHK